MNIPSKPSAIRDLRQAATDTSVWERLSSESTRWYARFNLFRMLGSGRSIESAWRQEQKTKTNKNGRAPDSWHKAAKRFEWRERALAWDVMDTERLGQEVLEERSRRLKRALNHRRRRETYLDGLERTLRQHTQNIVNKMSPAKNGRDIEWYEARVRAHFDFIERMMRLGEAEYAFEERLLAEVAKHQQQLSPSQSLTLTDEIVAATLELSDARAGSALLDRVTKRTASNLQTPALRIHRS